MAQAAPQFLTVGTGKAARRIAVLHRPGTGPGVLFLSGYRSDMRGSKAEALDAWAARSGRAFTRFDYSGHGEAGGRFEEGTIGRWFEEAQAVFSTYASGPTIVVGSSMGGWLALLLARARLKAGRPLAGLVLIAPAPDFTEELMWARMPDDVRETLMTEGVYLQPTPYAPEPYPITRTLIEDGRNHLLLGGPIETGCHVEILQGLADEDVPWSHALRLVDRLATDDVVLSLVKNAGHRLARPEDLERMIGAVEAISGV